MGDDKWYSASCGAKYWRHPDDLKSPLERYREDEEPTDTVTIEDSFSDLTRSTFAVWMRLCFLDRDTLSIGIRALSKHIGMHFTKLHYHLNILRDKGYIRMRRTDTPGQLVSRTKVIINKSLLVGTNHSVSFI